MSDQLTKREQIAAMALQGLLANSNQEVVNMGYEVTIESSIEFADMLIDQIKMYEEDEK